jgi:hypothetical protein
MKYARQYIGVKDGDFIKDMMAQSFYDTSDFLDLYNDGENFLRHL